MSLSYANGGVATFQGDQIGQIFACWAIVYFGHCFANTEVAQNFGPLVFTMPVIYLVNLTKMGWTAFWGTLKKSHLITLQPLLKSTPVHVTVDE
jgi:hypothetical protein